MKVGTDGVLLGAWTEINDCESLLDVGTGSGLIALMLAQRGNDSFQIDAIDAEEKAVEQAKENINLSPFKKLSCNQISFQEYAVNCYRKYDIIVSNPPFFVSSLKSPYEQRTLARHTDSLPIEDFISASKKLLSGKGKISFIYPHSEKNYLLKLSEKYGLFPSRITNVFPRIDVAAKRVLMELSVINLPLVESNLIIERERHIYTDEFIDLVKDFYLKM